MPGGSPAPPTKSSTRHTLLPVFVVVVDLCGRLLLYVVGSMLLLALPAVVGGGCARRQLFGLPAPAAVPNAFSQKKLSF